MPHGPDLYRDEIQKAELEVRNTRLQFKWLEKSFKAAGQPFILTPELVKASHYWAIRNIYTCAGQYRTASVAIKGSPHKPPEAEYVLGLVEDACERVRDNLDWNPVKTAAFLMWRLNWIHPFAGGNGRASRAVSYLAFCVNIGFVPKAKITFSELIDRERQEYFAALRNADEAWAAYNTLDTSRMEAFLDRLLGEQFLAIWRDSI